MSVQTFQISAGATTPTPIVTRVAGHVTPFQELRLNPSTADYYFGNSDVSSTKYFAKVATGGSAVIVANGPAAIAIDVLENCYVISGTGTITINAGALTL